MDLTSNPVFRFITTARDFGLEKAARRYYGLYHGQVATNVDLHQEGKIKVKVPVLGFGVKDATGRFLSNTLGVAAFPGSPYAGQDHGFYFPPEIGSNVWVSFDHGDPSQPRYHGGWWTNPAAARTPDTSQVPAEFRSATGSPLVRGIKTKQGHGLAFSDDPAAPYTEIWTGVQNTPNQPADRRQQFILSDKPGGEKIGAYSFKGARVELNDALQTLTINTPADDPAGLISHSIVINNLLNTVTVKSKKFQQIVMDDNTSIMAVTTPGALVIGATGGIAMGSGATPAPPVAGNAVETGIGNKIITFIGNITETIGGNILKTVAGSLTETVIGPLVVNALSAALLTTGGPVLIGSVAGAQFFVVDQKFLEAYFNHGHIATGPAAPTGKPVWISVPSPVDYPAIVPPVALSPQTNTQPGLHTSTTTTVN